MADYNAVEITLPNVNAAANTPQPTHNIVPSTSFVYKLRGYYTVSSVFETWFGNTPTTPNPSGNPLVGTTVVARLRRD